MTILLSYFLKEKLFSEESESLRDTKVKIVQWLCFPDVSNIWTHIPCKFIYYRNVLHTSHV